MARGGGVRTVAVVLFAVGIVVAPGCRKNHSPETPEVPAGPSTGAVGVAYTFSSSAEDSAGDDVAIRFDWGDGDTSDWSAWVRPGDTVAMNHTWSSSGSFNVRAQARVTNSLTTDWSAALTLSRYYEWTRVFSRPGDDYVVSVRQTSDGGYIILHNTDSCGAEDAAVWLIKIDDAGNKVWERTVGGAGDDWGNSLQLTRDGGCVVTGSTSPSGANYGDLWLFKMDALGSLLWQKVYLHSDGSCGMSVQQTRDGGYVVAAERILSGGDWADVWLVRTDSNGDTLWTKTCGDSEQNAFWVGQTDDGGYAIAGYENSSATGDADFWLARTDANGDTLWNRTYSRPGHDVCLSAGLTQDGGCILVGYTTPYGGGPCDAWLVKTGVGGEEVWDRVFGGPDYDYGEAVQQTTDGGYVLGFMHPAATIIKTTADGDTMWTRDCAPDNRATGSDVRQTADGGYIIAGSTTLGGEGGKDIWLTKTGPNGELDEGGGK